MLCFNLRFGLGRGDDIVERHIQLHTGAAKAGSITVTVSLPWVGSEKDLRTFKCGQLGMAHSCDSLVSSVKQILSGFDYEKDVSDRIG